MRFEKKPAQYSTGICFSGDGITDLEKGGENLDLNTFHCVFS